MTPRVAVAHPFLVAGGGSEACALWTIQALQDDHRVTLITMGRPDLDVLNAKYRTTIDLAKLETRFLALPPGTRTRFDALRGFPLARHCRRHARDFEVLFSAYNVMDFGVRGIQTIADFSFDDSLRRELDLADGVVEKPFRRASPARSIYLGLARVLAGTRAEGWRRNRTLANSQWTRDLLLERFGLESEVVYPPVSAEFPRIPWEEREDGFVVMGRLVPEKGIGLVVDILNEVRRTMPVHLHIIGRRVHNAYARELEALCRRHGDWIRLEGEMYGPEKEAFLAKHKYGLSGCRTEAFGIAVAEMVKAGLIVWVPDRGGQTEIVADRELTYAGPEEAVGRIRAVLADPARATALRRHLERRPPAFSAGRFTSDVRRIVADFLKEGRDRGA